MLKKILVIQEKSNKNRVEKLGKGFSTAKRFNPYNPLTYIVLFSILLIGILLFGVVGIWKEVDLRNPFSWY